LSRRAARLALPLLLLLAACATPPAQRRAGDLLNPQLSPGLSQWLVGPIARLATPEEVQQYLALTDDAAAQAFIEAFWTRRDPSPPANGNPLRRPNLRERFEARAAEADKRFAEAGYLGRRTDRGTIFVLYGEPRSVDFDIHPEPDKPAIERWTYAGDAKPGLDGRKPDASYRFLKTGDLTVLYRAPLQTREPQPPGFF
jgi:GWxTD domain-containing protein